MALLEVKDLRVHFPTPAGPLQAVRGVSFQLQPGRTLALVGESGSGKSVTGRAILGLNSKAADTTGEISLEGKDILPLSEEALCPIRGKRIAMVFQDPMSSLNPIMRIGQQITEVMDLPRKQAKEKAISLLREVGIRDPEGCFRQYPFQLSGGMRQRIVIAIALAADPQILICDEPTTALDVTIQGQILNLLDRLKRQRDLSMLFITHDFGVVANVADDIAVMYAGKIVEYGRAEEVFYDPRHPYTWALLSAMPDLHSSGRLYAIPGAPPNMTCPPIGDAFAHRNPQALEIDFFEEPPPFFVSDTHWAATWLLDPRAPKAQMPQILRQRLKGGGQLGS